MQFKILKIFELSFTFYTNVNVSLILFNWFRSVLGQLFLPFLQLDSFLFSFRKFSFCFYCFGLNLFLSLFFKNIQYVNFRLNVVLILFLNLTWLLSSIGYKDFLTLDSKRFLLTICYNSVDILWMIKLNESKISKLIRLVFVFNHSYVFDFSQLWKFIKKYCIVKILDNTSSHHQWTRLILIEIFRLLSLYRCFI